MNKDLKERVEAVLKLDAKRTQGDWQYSAGGYLAGCGDYDCSSIYLLDGEEVHKHPETGDDLVFEVAGTIILGEDGECLGKDIEFMSKAPEMVLIIKELVATLEHIKNSPRYKAEKGNISLVECENCKELTEREAKLVEFLKGLLQNWDDANDLATIRALSPYRKSIIATLKDLGEE